MRRICKTGFTIGVVALFLGGTASAADMRRSLPSEPLLQNPPLLVDEFSSGWYLRGDIGYRWNKLDDVTNDGPLSVSNGDLGKSWMVGAGFGYKWEWFRSDLTVDYGTKATFSADSSAQTNDFKSKIDTVTGLVNVYGDLGTWFGLTPYIGAGAGFAHLQSEKFNNSAADIESAAKWNFAWAYMAGLSYRFGSNYSIDLGYRHVNMGDMDTDRSLAGDQLKLKKVSTDEVRLGFRYAID